jgi:hypothetical protein
MKGICTYCEREFKLRNGVVVFHRQRDVFVEHSVLNIETPWPQPPCPGWALPPQEEAHVAGR